MKEVNPYYEIEKKAKEREARGYRIEVKVYNQDLEKALRRLRKQLTQGGVISDFKKHQYYSTPSQRKRMKKYRAEIKARLSREKYESGGADEEFFKFAKLARHTKKFFSELETAEYKDYAGARPIQKEEEEETDKKTVVAVAVAAETCDGKLLILKAKKKKKLGFPGGMVEEGEDIFAAVDREFNEETGIATDTLDKNLICYIPLQDNNNNSSRAIYMAGIFIRFSWLADEAEEMIVPGDEIEFDEETGEYKIGFFSRDEIAEIIDEGEFLPNHLFLFEELWPERT